MAKGPAPKGEYAGKSSVFSTRIRPDLRKELEKAARQSGRSLSQEVEHRLRSSFVEDNQIADLFGDRRTYRLMRMMADAIHTAEEITAMGPWLETLTAFKIAKGAAIGVLERVAPKDDSPFPPSLLSDELVDRTTKAAGDAIATSTWRRVQQADPALPLHRGSREQAKASVARQDLVDILERTKKAALDLESLQELAALNRELFEVKGNIRKARKETK